METIKKHLSLIMFLSGILIGVSGVLLFRKTKEVKVVFNDNKTIDYLKHYYDSLIVNYDKEIDSKNNTIKRLQSTESKIDKKLNHDKSIINNSDNIDSLSKSAIYYINHF